MTRIRRTLALLLAATSFAPALQAGEREESCRAQAERLSGYRPGGIEGEAGGVTFRLGGSAAFGISRSQRTPAPAAPPFAGAAHRERFEAERNRKRAARYQAIYDDCMGKSED